MIRWGRNTITIEITINMNIFLGMHSVHSDKTVFYLIIVSERSWSRIWSSRPHILKTREVLGIYLRGVSLILIIYRFTEKWAVTTINPFEALVWITNSVQLNYVFMIYTTINNEETFLQDFLTSISFRITK